MIASRRFCFTQRRQERKGKGRKKNNKLFFYLAGLKVGNYSDNYVFNQFALNFEHFGSLRETFYIGEYLINLTKWVI
jgi:hypothetical protein